MTRTSARARRLPAVLLVLALAAAAGAGCARTAAKSAGAAGGASGPERAQALIEAGNALFRGGDYPGAAKRYGAAVAAAPGDPAAHYGLGMALAKLGRDEDARAEYARARDLAESARSADSARVE